MNTLRLLPLLLGSVLTATAQTPTDSLTPFDTIGIQQQRVLFIRASTYSYHAATQLSGGQLMPLLLRSPDSTVRRLALRSQRLTRATLPLILSGYGLVLLAVRTSAVNRNAELGGVMALGGLGTLVTGEVLGLSSAPGVMNRAVRRYNQQIGYSENAYARPALRVSGTDFELTQADTINIRKQGIGYRYTYRGIQVAPDLHLAAAMKSVKDPFVTEGLRQNGVFRGIGGAIGGLSAGFVTGYFLTRFIAQAAGVRVRPVNPLAYVALGGIAISFSLGRLTDKTTRQVVQRYNEQVTPGSSRVAR